MADALELEDDITSTEVEPAEPTPSPAPAQSNDDLREAMKTLTQSVTQLATPKETPKTKSPEELEEEWAVFNPKKADEKFFQDFFGLPEDVDPKVLERKMKLFADTQKGFVKQAVTAALKVMREHDLKSLRDEYEPVREHVSKAKAEATASRFYSKYSALRDSDQPDGMKFSGIVNAVARELADKDFASEDDYFKALAEGAAAKVKGVLPSFDLGAVKTKPSAGTSPSLPRTRVGGSGGTGSGSGSQPKGKADDDSASIDW